MGRCTTTAVGDGGSGGEFVWRLFDARSLEFVMYTRELMCVDVRVVDYVFDVTGVVGDWGDAHAL